MLMHMSQVAVVPTSVALHCNRTVHHVSLSYTFGDTCKTNAKPLGGAVGWVFHIDQYNTALSLCRHLAIHTSFGCRACMSSGLVLGTATLLYH